MSSASCVLEDRGLLLHILEYVGFGNWLLAAGVSRGWKIVYATISFAPSTHENWSRNNLGAEPVTGFEESWGYHGDDIHITLASAAMASLACLQWAVDCGLSLHDGGINEMAGRHAAVPVLLFANEHGMQWDADVTAGALQSICRHKLEWLREQQRFQLPARRINPLIAQLTPSTLSWLKAHAVDLKLEEYTLHAGCAKHLSLEVLQYLRSEGCELASTYYKFAALRADRAVITWLHEQGFSCEVLHLCNFAASNGSVEQLQWLVERGMQLEPSALACALREGRTAAVQFLVANGLQLEHVPDPTALVARTGNLPLLQWLQEQGYDVMHENPANEAARSGNVQMVVWLQSQGVEFQSSLFATAAAHGGSLPMLQHLISTGCDWSAPAVCLVAAGSGSMSILRYMKEREPGVWSAADLTKMLNRAGSNDRIYTAKWLRKQCAPWPAMLGSFVGNWLEAAVAWARRQGCTAPLFSEHIAAAAAAATTAAAAATATAAAAEKAAATATAVAAAASARAAAAREAATAASAKLAVAESELAAARAAEARAELVEARAAEAAAAAAVAYTAAVAQPVQTSATSDVLMALFWLAVAVLAGMLLKLL
jgi:pyruvate/2-oxoglutarate dehydrogenase complex dihydrolipoamide acyltransferase (E2) component